MVRSDYVHFITNYISHVFSEEWKFRHTSGKLSNAIINMENIANNVTKCKGKEQHHNVSTINQYKKLLLLLPGTKYIL